MFRQLTSLQVLHPRQLAPLQGFSTTTQALAGWGSLKKKAGNVSDFSNQKYVQKKSSALSGDRTNTSSRHGERDDTFGEAEDDLKIKDAVRKDMPGRRLSQPPLVSKHGSSLRPIKKSQELTNRPRGVQDYYSNLKIYRNGRPDETDFSVDASWKEIERALCEGRSGQSCTICGDPFAEVKPLAHKRHVKHKGRLAIALELLRAHCGTPDEVCNMFWRRLDESEQFTRVKSLSHHNHTERRHRLLYLLNFLRDRQVLHICFDVGQMDKGVGVGRSWEFERLEWIGDQAIKWLFGDRMMTLFPLNEGGIQGDLNLIQNMVDGNQGLAATYDHFGFESLTGSGGIVVSKFKSDVVEALFGEMISFLWSTEAHSSPDSFTMPLGTEVVTLRTLVQHTMQELAHCMIMQHFLSVAESLNKIIAVEKWNFIAADIAPSYSLNVETVPRSGRVDPYSENHRDKSTLCLKPENRPKLGGLSTTETTAKSKTAFSLDHLTGDPKTELSNLVIGEDYSCLDWLSKQKLKKRGVFWSGDLVDWPPPPVSTTEEKQEAVTTRRDGNNLGDAGVNGDSRTKTSGTTTSALSREAMVLRSAPSPPAAVPSLNEAGSGEAKEESLEELEDFLWSQETSAIRFSLS